MKTKDLQIFNTEIDKIKKWEREAGARMIKQRAAGDLDAVNRSRRIIEYCKRYGKQLKHIIDGMKHDNKSQYLTKVEGNRYIDKTSADRVRAEWEKRNLLKEVDELLKR